MIRKKEEAREMKITYLDLTVSPMLLCSFGTLQFTLFAIVCGYCQGDYNFNLEFCHIY
jgi:hypothetical protein